MITQLNFVRVDQVFPPTATLVVTLQFHNGSPRISTDELRPGFGKRQDPSLFYWQSGDDFDEVTYWAELPAGLPKE